MDLRGPTSKGKGEGRERGGIPLRVWKGNEERRGGDGRKGEGREERRGGEGCPVFLLSPPGNPKRNGERMQPCRTPETISKISVYPLAVFAQQLELMYSALKMLEMP